MNAVARIPTHFVHLMLGLGAIVVLLAYVILDIRKNGWRSFARKIRSREPSEKAPSSTKRPES